MQDFLADVLSTTYTDNDINDVLNNDILQVSRYQTFENSNTIIFHLTKRHTAITNTIATKIKKLTVLSSPHIDKKAREQFEMRIFQKHLNRSLSLQNFNDEHNYLKL